MWVLSEPIKSICETIRSGEWNVYCDRWAVVLSHKSDDELTITFTKDLSGAVLSVYGCAWMTSQEKAHLTSFVKGWLPTYHRNRFMKLVKG